MSKKLLSLLLAMVLAVNVFLVPDAVSAAALPKLSGRIFFHTYSDYNAGDSQIYMYDFGKYREINAVLQSGWQKNILCGGCWQ